MKQKETLSLESRLFSEFSEKAIGIFGLGREGRSTYNFFRQLFPEKELILADEFLSSKEQLPFLKEDKNIKIFSKEEIYTKIAPLCEAIFKAPGIPYCKFPKEAQTKITSQVDLFLKYFSHQTIGITGTKGKSTTSSLAYACLQSCGVKSILAGNIGVPLLDKFYEIDSQTMIVAELSAHQLENITVAPKYAVFLNLFEEHLDAFGTFEAYRDAKYNIVAKQKHGDIVLHGSLNKEKLSKIYGNNRILHPITIDDYYTNFSRYDIKLQGSCIMQPKHLFGDHNLFNIAVVYKLCSILGLNEQNIINTCLEFKGLAHRLEFIGSVEGVNFYNDSISTTPQSTIAAIETLKNVETLLLGGMDRGINYDILGKEIPKHKIKNIALIGKAGERISKILQDAGYRCNYLTCDNYSEIILWAKSVTEAGKAVLLSPAAASYDQFKNFEQRGDTFRQLVLDN